MMRNALLSLSLVFSLVLVFPPSPLGAAENEAPRKLSKEEEKKRMKRLRKELRGAVQAVAGRRCPVYHHRR